MADSTASSALDVMNKVLNQYSGLNDSTKKLVTNINTQFSFIKISTAPFDKVSSAMDKMKTIMSVLNFPKMALGVVQSTTAMVANTLATNANTAAKNTGIIATAKDIAENVQLAAIYAKERMESMAATIQLVAMYAQDKAGLLANTIAQNAHTLATNAAALAQKALNLVMSMNPIGIVIALIVALVATIVILWNKNAAFRDFVTGMLDGIVKFVQSSAAAISGLFSGLWGSIVAIFTPIGNWFSGVFNGAWNGIRNAFAGAVGFFSGLWGSIVGVFSSIGSAIGNAVGGAFKSVVNSILDFAQNTINGFFRDINGAIGVVNRIPGVHIPVIPSLSLPRLALGGIIDAPTIAMLGEAGREAVVPLENTGFVAAIGAAVGKAVSAALSSSAAGNGDTGDVGVTLQIDREVLGRATVRAINNQIRRTGAIPLNI